MNYSVTQIVKSFTLTTTWSPWELHDALSSPCWTLSTLAAFYIMFPILLPTLETFSNNMLTLLIVIMYHAQCLPYVLSWYVTHDNGMLEGYVIMHPLFRLPVFIMGCATGLLLLRGEQYSPEDYGVLQDIFPWKISSSETPVSTSSNWPRRIDRNSLILILSIIYFVVKSTVLETLPLLHIFGQFFLCHVQLVVIVGLIKDKSSLVSQLCR